MEGFKNWEFMTTHCWGEKAAGDWILEIYDSPSQLRSQKAPGTFSKQNTHYLLLQPFLHLLKHHMVLHRGDFSNIYKLLGCVVYRY